MTWQNQRGTWTGIAIKSLLKTMETIYFYWKKTIPCLLLGVCIEGQNIGGCFQERNRGRLGGVHCLYVFSHRVHVQGGHRRCQDHSCTLFVLVVTSPGLKKMYRKITLFNSTRCWVSIVHTQKGFCSILDCNWHIKITAHQSGKSHVSWVTWWAEINNKKQKYFWQRFVHKHGTILEAGGVDLARFVLLEKHILLTGAMIQDHLVFRQNR